MADDKDYARLCELIPGPGARMRWLFNQTYGTNIPNGTGVEVCNAISRVLWDNSELVQKSALLEDAKGKAEGND